MLNTSYLSPKKIYEVICQQLEIIEKQGKIGSSNL